MTSDQLVATMRTEATVETIAAMGTEVIVAAIKPRSLPGHISTTVGVNNDIGSHRNKHLGQHNSFCCSFGQWLSTKQPPHVTACDLAWRTPLEFHRTPKNTHFQSC
jgi:hypothetical protein